MSDTGLIVTNAHVVSSTRPVSGRQQLKVQMHNGDVYEATIKDIDKKSDIATIKVNPLVRGMCLRIGVNFVSIPVHSGSTLKFLIQLDLKGCLLSELDIA